MSRNPKKLLLDRSFEHRPHSFVSAGGWFIVANDGELSIAATLIQYADIIFLRS